MARPKKQPITPREADGVAAFQHTHGDPLPTRVDVLQETICALLNRMQRMDGETARQAAVFLKVLAARCAYWDKTRSIPQDGVELNREWNEYRDLLCEIALGKKTKLTHCRESVLDQGRLLDQYLDQHSEFFKCRNLVTRQGWIVEHEPAIVVLLSVIPCFCTYGDGAILTTPSRPLKHALSGQLTPGRFRDILLGMLHGTTHSQIAKIRKGASSFTTDKLMYRPLDDVLAFPS